jgi:hypothetical protein
MKPLLPWKSSKCSEQVFVTFVVQHAKHMHHIVICRTSSSTNFRIISQMAQFSGEGKLIEYKMCVFSLQLLSVTLPF